MNEDRLIIGLDFGTTFTGVAFAYSGTPEDVEVIKTWPGGNGITSDKVPTEISYGHQVLRWGSLIKPEDKRIRCIKLFLDKDQELPPFVSAQDITGELRKAGRGVLDCATDFLTQISKHTIDTANKRFTETFVRNTTVQFVVTVPAVWSDKAKTATRAAAELAGIPSDSIRMISEPEAAACYTLKVIQPNHLVIGNNLVVCDAGGGTVDLITYRIKKLNPVELEESGIGSGGLCGSALTNFRFEDHVRERLGGPVFQQMVNNKPKTWHTGLKYWEEHVKRNFHEGDEEEFNVPFPGLADSEQAGIDSGFMTLTSDQVRDIFEPVIREVIRMIEVQVDAVQSTAQSVHAILLVGGFGQSRYLYERARQHFDSTLPPDNTVASSPAIQRARSVVVMQPPNAWTAVARGAVLRGLEGTIVSRRLSRYNYGISCNVAYNANRHPADSKYWDELDEMWRARNAMKWYVKRGESVVETRAIAFEFYCTYKGNRFPEASELIASDTLYYDGSDTVPSMLNHDTMKVLCTLVTDLNGVPRRCFRKKTNSSGRKFWTMDFTCEMRIDSAQLEFCLKVDGKEYGSVNASFKD